MSPLFRRWQIWCQRTRWKQITTQCSEGRTDPALANMVSKNEMKANHNSWPLTRSAIRVGKYGVKERDESKSQLFQRTITSEFCWQIWCQRTRWKQITTEFGNSYASRGLANMVSKNEMKANHNNIMGWPDPPVVGKYGVKERDESKSQLWTWVKTCGLSWQIWCQRTRWKQITTLR